METLSSFKIIANQLLDRASKFGVDIGQFLHADSGAFKNESRWMLFWMNDDSLCYRLSGSISIPPKPLAASRPSFQGIWDETGTIDDIEQAFQ
ncbi:MAG: hypothetical protein SNJ75_18985, partial [Gemmataceae bacterium]